ncbi:type III secretion system HrpP C-terminal domain-containing protein [Pseudomonas chlororaphis]|uniref:type III secretion system HrpP C-terminal domain-containing protein n=1 Tax=Pseudomonas chlororaphis TaxID=587753 RepID=UPI000F56497A|nr:type III secretion system HrpP C-terminal domain-containing protein [Pseudomonas chlororaphis]AZC84006.1 HrpP [Pseudomonas chlororaphis subsp. piscium]
MTPRTILYKATPRSPEPIRGHQEPQTRTWQVRHERIQDLCNENRSESEYFEQLLTSLDTQGQIIVADFSSGDFSNAHPQGQGETGVLSRPGLQTSVLWDAVLTKLEEQLGLLDKGPLEAQLELPNLGQIAVRMVQRGDTLEIALRFARDDALRYCTDHQSASIAWLSQQLGRSVRLTLRRGAH